MISAITNRSGTSQRVGTPFLGLLGEEKEFLDLEIELDMDEIEDWYREVDINLGTVTFKPAQVAINHAEPAPDLVELQDRTPPANPIPSYAPTTTTKAGLLGLRLNTALAKPVPRVPRRPPQPERAAESGDGSRGAILRWA